MPSAYRKRASVVRLLRSSCSTRLRALLPAMRSSSASLATPSLYSSGSVRTSGAVRRGGGRRPAPRSLVAGSALADQLVDQLLAQALDVHRPPAGEMQERLAALRGAEQAARAARSRCRPPRCTTSLPQTGQRDGSVKTRASAGRRSATTPTTSGITSPARRTITVSPMRTSFLRSSSSLCSVALRTVMPPTNTGSSLATGVSAPGAADLHLDVAHLVSCSCAGYLCATAQRGSRELEAEALLQRQARRPCRRRRRCRTAARRAARRCARGRRRARPRRAHDRPRSLTGKPSRPSAASSAVCVARRLPSRRPRRAHRRRSSARRSAATRASSWRTTPAAALRGLTKAALAALALRAR